MSGSKKVYLFTEEELGVRIITNTEDAINDIQQKLPDLLDYLKKNYLG